MKTMVKICCIASIDEARAAIAAGADAVGLVSAMPSGPGPIPDELITEIAAAVPSGVDSFLLTSETEPAAVVDHVRRCGTSVAQLVRRVPPATYSALCEECPGVRLVQVVHVEDERALAESQAVAPHVDSLLLDSGRPAAAVPELGGTGRPHDWALSARIVQAVAKPVYLAGGLNADNVAAAITQVRPYGVDLCSGVRTEDILDRDKLGRFLAAVSRTDNDYDVRPARPADFGAIVRLNAAWEHYTSRLDESALAGLHEQAARHEVITAGSEVVAFLLALREGAAYDSPNYRWFADRGGQFLYIDRVVVDRTHQGRGLAWMLYEDLFEFARTAGVARIVCEIDAQPPNERSRHFHERFGFREVGTQRLPGGAKTVSLRQADSERTAGT